MGNVRSKSKRERIFIKDAKNRYVKQQTVQDLGFATPHLEHNRDEIIEFPIMRRWDFLDEKGRYKSNMFSNVEDM